MGSDADASVEKMSAIRDLRALANRTISFHALAECHALARLMYSGLGMESLLDGQELDGRTIHLLFQILTEVVREQRVLALKEIEKDPHGNNPRESQLIAAAGELLKVSYKDDKDEASRDRLRKYIRGITDDAWGDMCEKNRAAKKRRQLDAGLWLGQRDFYSYKAAESRQDELLHALLGAVRVAIIHKAALIRQSIPNDPPAKSSNKDAGVSAGANREPVPERTKGDLKLSAGIANVTRGDTTYAKSVTAWVDDVLKIQMTYESTAVTKALRDFVPHFRLPSERSREHHVVVVGTAARGEHVVEVPITINSTVPTTLVYIPGSAKWRRNTVIGNAEPTHETADIEDSVIGPAPLPVDNVLPGPQHRATITILARVVSDQISVSLAGTSDLTKTERQDIAVRQGGVAHLRLAIRNCGNRTLRSLLVYCNLSDATSLVSGSVCLTKADGVAQPLPDDLIRNSDPTGNVRQEQVEDGLSIGELPVGETLNVEYEVRINKKAPVGSIATIVGVVRPLGMNEFYNTVKIAVQR